MATHMTRRRFLKTLGLAAGSAVLAACGGGETPAPAPAAGGEAKLEISAKGEELLYDKDRLVAPAGSKIALTFKNPSTVLSHNWVLVKPGTEERVAADGLAAGEAKGYLKDDDPDVLVKSKLLKPGENETITFDAPAKGSYPYICTFPGHHVLMKGTLVIE